MTITALERTKTAQPRLSRRPLRVVEPASPPPWPPRYVRPLRLVPPVAEVVPVTRAPRRVRVTRRGRLVLTSAIVAVVGALAIVSAHGPATRPAPGRVSAESVVVRPGDTLWAVAVRADPGADPRVTVERIVELNAMPDATVRPGQRLRLPRR